MIYGKNVNFKRTPSSRKPSKSSLSNQLFPKIIKMAPIDNMSSYQLLTEGHVEVIVEKKPHKINLTELLRDLYSKYYELKALVFENKEKLKVETGGPPDIE